MLYERDLNRLKISYIIYKIFLYLIQNTRGISKQALEGLTQAIAKLGRLFGVVMPFCHLFCRIFDDSKRKKLSE